MNWFRRAPAREGLFRLMGPDVDPYSDPDVKTPERVPADISGYLCPFLTGERDLGPAVPQADVTEAMNPRVESAYDAEGRQVAPVILRPCHVGQDVPMAVVGTGFPIAPPLTRQACWYFHNQPELDEAGVAHEPDREFGWGYRPGRTRKPKKGGGRRGG